uniref:Uncharacterized protein n=1 Tax=Fagus sylvatica TaxID=28930 RepID=A0A2N9G3Q0_FAGSY
MGASFATHMLLLLWFFTATFCLSFFKAEPHVSCNEKEKQALLTLKRGLTDPGNLLSSWSSDQEDCCRWERVRCDNKIGRVTELHLSSPLDADGFPSTTKRGWVLGNISGLRYLDLSGNDFNRAPIPSFLGSMGNSLTSLHLGLTSACDISSLRYLASWNDFNFVFRVSGMGSDIPQGLFSGLIPHQLGNLSGLQYLDLSSNDFNRAPIPKFPCFLGSMGNLRHLDLRRANFSGLIPHQLGNLSGLQYLGSADLHREVDWLQIMSKFSSLSELYLYDCQLDSLNPSLGFINFTSLRVLYLSENHFNHEIPNWFSNLSTTLLELDLMSSSLKGEIPESLGKLKHLKRLDLSANSLKGEIPESLGKLKHLKRLDLSANSLKGEIPESLGKLKHLEGLYLSSNSLNGPIPQSLGNLSEIQTLYLVQNQLNGTIPKSLGLLTNLESLYIGNNFLIGPVDEGHFTKLSKLRDLDISHTPLFFNVNSNWVPPFQLQYAQMSSSKIGPKFPTWLQTQTSLRILLISDSGISNEAPSWFWNWISNIERLDLSSNHIEGDVSDIVLNSTFLNLRSNHFKGRLPQLSENVQVLNIANNSLSGQISTFLCHTMNRKNKLKVFDASNNLLSGEFSQCWRYWQSLIHLNLGSNSLSGKIPYSMGSLGEIPPSMSNLTFLSQLDLSYNNLSGKIPSSTQLQSFDALSYTGNPQLCGDPLPKKCTVEEKPLTRTPIGKTEDHSENSNFYMGMGVGFPVGFWAICGILFFKRTWRHAYFKFLDDIQDWVYVTTVPNVNWFLGKLKKPPPQ